jgi:putative inorganic carbon (HCO3(-)) transporter
MAGAGKHFMGTGLGHIIPYAAYAGFWIMCIASLAGRPRLGLYYMMPFIAYRTMRDKFEVMPLGSNVVTILLLCIIIGGFIAGKRPAASRMFLTWFLFAGYLYLSLWIGVFISDAPMPLWLNDANFVAWKDYMVLPLLLLASSMVLEDRKQIRTAIILTAFSLFIVDRSALLESLSHSWAVFDENKRTSGPLEYGPNQLAAFLAQFGLFFWALAASLKRYKVKLVLYALTGLTMVTMLYAFSRAGYVATLVGILVLGLLKDRKLLIVLGVFLFTWQTLVPTAVSERITMTQEGGQLDASAQERIDLWEQSRKIFYRSPIVGAGFGTFQFGEHTDSLKDTHNYFVKVLTETGVVGFIFFMVLLFQMLGAGWSLFRKAQDPLFKALGLGYLVAVTGCILANCFGDRWTYVEINGLLWVLTGAVLRAMQLEKPAATEEIAVPSGRPMPYAGAALRAPVPR